MTTFAMGTYHNQHLAAGATQVDAIVTVTASGSGAAVAGTPTAAAEIIILDISGSMKSNRKLQEAKRATAAAIDCIRDGVAFAVIAGDQVVYDVFPGTGQLATASSETRAQAKEQVDALTAGGGTAIGSWLRAANEMFPDDPGVIRHAILLTDGQNQNETAQELAAALDECEGRFQCDCRGVGTDWVVDEVRTIASRLLGTVDMIAKPEEMEGDFRTMMELSMGKATADAVLRLWCPAGSTVGFVKEVNPRLEDLTARRVEVSELVGDYPTGAWGDETRDYHVNLQFPSRALDAEMLAARVSLVVDGDVVSQALVNVTWTDDISRSTKVVNELEGYVAQQESARLTQEGLAALERGDLDLATDKLVRAQSLYEEAGNIAQADRIKELLEVDPTDGTTRVKREVEQEDVMGADLGTGKTERVVPRS
jgi:hypothetical protein